MKKADFKVGTLLYHLNHGVVRVASVLNNKNKTGDRVVSYALLPFKADAGKVRFVATLAALKSSGFHEPATKAEGNRVLRYLSSEIASASLLPGVTKTGPASLQKNQLGDFARSLLSFAFKSFDGNNRTHKLQLEQAAKGVIGELSFSLQTTQKEMVEKVKESLGSAKMNPLVLAALERL